MAFAHLTGAFALITATLGGLVVLLPGLTLTTALSELATRHLASGAARLSGAFITFLSIVFGVAFGNLFLGVPFHFTPELLPVYDGSFLGLFRPFALATGLLSLAMLVMHGAAFIAMKVEEPVGGRARRVSRGGAVASAAISSAAAPMRW